MKVELVSKTVGVGEYENLNPEEIIAAVARHGAIKDDNGKLVKYLMDNAHWSPLQFVQYTFKIQTSRRISAQIFRHQNNHQEWSQRYSKSNQVEPIELRLEHPTNRQSSTDVVGTIVQKENDFRAYMSGVEGIDNNELLAAADEAAYALRKIEAAYDKLINAGVAKECAANILPMASTTYIHVGANLRSWLSFLNVRCDHHAQKEIREIANAIGEALEKELPNVFTSLDWRNGMFM